MTTPGKNFPGQKGFPTPNNTPGDTVRRIFIVPNSEEWLGLLEGAAQVLLDEWRYYDWGALTPAETVAAFNEVILASYTNVCQCANPDGGKIIRINPNGHVQEIGEDGTWTDPTGDYEIPPVPAREGGTEEDQICLAATNCANVLQLLYENLSDSWNAALNDAEALTAFILALVALIGAEFAPITFALVTFFGWLFGVLYETLAFVGADLWDENFTKALVCILVDCATNTAGVVTFDWACFNNELAANTNIFDLTASQLRLFGQIQFILSCIGGVDALNQAGATTAITGADCSACASEWCITNDCTDNSDGWSVQFGGSYVGGADGWQPTDVASGGLHYRDLEILLDLGASYQLTEVGMEFDFVTGDWDSDAYNSWAIFVGAATPFELSDVVTHGDTTDGLGRTLIFALDNPIRYIYLEIVTSTTAAADYTGSATLKNVTLRGTGTKPVISGWVDC